MPSTDPISDFLTVIRNGLKARHGTVQVPTSKMKEKLAEIFKREGFISDFRVKPGKAFGLLEVDLSYRPSGEPVVHKLRRVSRLSCRRYATSEEMAELGVGITTTIVTTSRGLMTNREAEKAHVGGELICEVL